MKKLKLKTDTYRILIANYKEWLDILGYAESTVYCLPNHLQEFFYYLEQHHIRNINHITTEIVSRYYRYLQERSNQRRNGALSKSYLNKHQQALKKFKEYLKNHHHRGITVPLKSEQEPTEEKRNILTQSEIKELFTATAYSNTKSHLRCRDKAMLVILYSCGLRRNEAVNLDIGDIYFEKQRIFVRKGKNYKERFVPINRKNVEILEDYIYEARPQFKDSHLHEALFINKFGTRMQGASFANRLQAIVKASENKTIAEKQITPHTLRHSIATHLLQHNVKLENIKTFLGHTSLESTQIYAHILKIIDYE